MAGHITGGGVHDVDGGGQGAAVRVPQLCVMWKISFYQCWPTVSLFVIIFSLLR